MKDGKQKDLFKSEFPEDFLTPAPITPIKPTQALYLHGLGSGPQSSKAQIFAEYFLTRGIAFNAPDLNIPSFAALSPLRILSYVRDLIVLSEGEVVILGASFGGYLALHATAQLAPEVKRRIAALVLLAPAIDPWLKEGTLITTERNVEWREKGSYPLLDYRTSERVSVHYQLVSELEELGVAPNVSDIKTGIIHGTLDQIVPVRGSREFVERNPSVQLYEFEDDHSLLGEPHLLKEKVDLILQM